MLSITRDDAVVLDRRFAALSAEKLLDVLIQREFAGSIRAISSFGTESALLLALLADIDPNLPILFLDTGKHFPETLAYRDTLIGRLGLTGVKTIHPSTASLHENDPDGALWQFDTDACCRLRKVYPLEPALGDTAAVISGRKRYHGALRQFLPRVHAVDGRLRIDPLARWSEEEVAAEFERRNLPEHPLKSRGYSSVGCAPCTIAVGPDAGIRDGRWAGSAKTECGIHLTARRPVLEAAH